MRKPLLLMICLWLAVCSYASAQNKTGKGGDEAAVLQAEKQRFDLMIKKDLNGLRSALADDLLYTHSSGVTENKEEYLAGFQSGKSVYYDIRPEETKVR